MEIAPSGAVIRIESTWAFSSHLGLVAQLLILKMVTSYNAKEKLTLFSIHRQGENFSSHGFPLWFVELPRVVEEDRADGGLVYNMISDGDGDCNVHRTLPHKLHITRPT